MKLSSLVQQVVEVAKSSARTIRTERENFDMSKVQLKGKRDLVSYVDKNSERLLVEKLSDIFPEAGFLTEEKTTVQLEKEYTWVIDPLDGTTNFVHGIPNYCVSIALMQERNIVLGVVYEIVHDECFYAWEGGGSYLNGNRIEVSKEPSIQNSLFATGFPISNFDHIEAYLHILSDLMKESHGIRRMGSAAADMCYVACGRYGAYFERNISIWDIAAGVVIVKEAGGTVTDFEGKNNFLFGKQIVSGGEVHTPLLEIIKKRSQ